MKPTRRSGRATKLTGQVGEYLVAAELARRGLIATTFTGNVPHYDIIASDERGRHVSVQVKTSHSLNWQFRIDHFAKVEFRGQRQVVRSSLRTPVNRLVVILVKLADEGERDRFFVCTWEQLRDILVKQYRSYLRKHGGRRPMSPESLHCAFRASSASRFEDRWSMVSKSLR